MHLKALSVSCGHECEGVNDGHPEHTEENLTLGWKMLHLSLEIRHIKSYTQLKPQKSHPFEISVHFSVPNLASTGLMTCARLSELSV